MLLMTVAWILTYGLDMPASLKWSFALAFTLNSVLILLSKKPLSIILLTIIEIVLALLLMLVVVFEKIVISLF